jgi:hypothetical protein
MPVGEHGSGITFPLRAMNHQIKSHLLAVQDKCAHAKRSRRHELTRACGRLGQAFALLDERAEETDVRERICSSRLVLMGAWLSCHSKASVCLRLQSCVGGCAPRSKRTQTCAVDARRWNTRCRTLQRPPGMKCESHLACMQLNMTLERLDRVQFEFMPANSSLAHTVSREVAADSEWPLPQRSSDSWLLRRSADGTAASNANGAEVRVAGNPSTIRDWESEAHASAAAGGREAAAKRDRPQTRAALPARTLEVV